MSALNELFFSTTGAANPHDTDLNVTIPATGEPTHDFSKIAHVIAKGDTLAINLVPKGPGSATCTIVGYCATLTDPAKIKVTSITINGVPVSNPTHVTYPAGTTRIEFELNLDPRELILIGIIVEVVWPGGQKKRYLCDPQVGNGPP